MIYKVLAPETHGFHWFDIIDPSPDELQGVAEEFGLHATSLEDCLDPRHQPKYERVGKVVFIITREIHWFRGRVSAIRRVFRQSYDVILKFDDYPDKVAPHYQDIRERLERYIALTDALREAGNDILKPIFPWPPTGPMR